MLQIRIPTTAFYHSAAIILWIPSFHSIPPHPIPKSHLYSVLSHPSIQPFFAPPLRASSPSESTFPFRQRHTTSIDHSSFESPSHLHLHDAHAISTLNESSVEVSHVQLGPSFLLFILPSQLISSHPSKVSSQLVPREEPRPPPPFSTLPGPIFLPCTAEWDRGEASYPTIRNRPDSSVDMGFGARERVSRLLHFGGTDCVGRYFNVRVCARLA
jgi:hypothetical protein